MSISSFIVMSFLCALGFNTTDKSKMLKNEMIELLENQLSNNEIDSTNYHNYFFLLRKWNGEERVSFLNSLNDSSLSNFYLYEEITFKTKYHSVTYQNPTYRACVFDSVNNKVIKTTLDINKSLEKLYESKRTCEIGLYPKSSYNVVGLSHFNNSTVSVRMKINVVL